MTELALSIPKDLRRGLLRWQELESVESGVKLISLLCKTLQLEDLGSSSVLDMGCGCKFTQAILDRNLPVGQYTGVDVYAEMIDFLHSNVTDPRFSFHHMNTHNEMYNPNGEPLSGDSPLSLNNQTFDIISLLSVFTHLAPHDYVSMLKMLRKYVKPDGRLFFSLFVHEETPGGFGQIDALMKAFSTADEALKEKQRRHFEEGLANPAKPDFVDFMPEQPLQIAMYSRKHALELIENTGWEVVSLNDPVDLIQHYIVCKPV